jgi:integrase
VGSACVEIELVVLASALKLAKRRGLWSGTWADIAPRNPSDGRPQRTRWLTHEEVKRLTAALPKDRGEWVWVACYTGMRISEMNRTKWSDIDMNAALLSVPGTKSKHASRVVPLAPAILELLEYRREIGDPPVTNWDQPYEILDRTTEALGMPRVIPHDMRRTFASWLLQAGVQERAIADMLGHGGLELVRTVYAHLSQDHLRAAIARLP